MTKLNLVFCISFALGPIVNALPTADVPILGSTFPSDFDLTQTDAFLEATENFPRLIEELFASGAVNESETSFAIDVFSSVTNTSIYHYYHSGPVNEEYLTAGELNDDTIFRVGSVSKLYTIYAILAQAGLDILRDPVTKYLPELSGNSRDAPLTKIVWEDITVGALAAHQAGTGGFPLEFQNCWVVDRASCNANNFLTYMRDVNPPVIPAFETTLYSDGGYGVLGRVLERITNLTYSEALQTLIVEPLGLNSTSTFVPEGEFNALAFPQNSTTWGLDNQVTAPSGGVYSNAADLRAVGLSILHSRLLSPAATRSWMKPLGHTGTLTTSVGAPWEINRLSIPVSANSSRTRISDLYTKLGGNPPYGSVFALSPDHNIGFTINVAPDVRIALRDVVGEAFVVAAEHAAWENAERNFAGTFADESTEGRNLTLTVGDDVPGIGLRSWYYEGEEARAAVGGVATTLPPANVSVRLYPRGLEREEGNTKRMLFGASAQRRPNNVHADVEGGATMFDRAITWQSVDFNNAPTSFGYDEFLFELVDGRLSSVTHRALNVTMTRVE